MPFPNIDPFAFGLHAQFDFLGRHWDLGIRWYALAYVAGILIGWRYVLGLVKNANLWGPKTPTLNPPQVDDLVFIVNEVTTNAIRHGAGYGHVLVWREGQRLLCEVTDPGEAKGDMFGAIPPDPDSEHGHGLWVARQLCDLLEIRTRQPGTTVRIHMRLPE